MKTWKHYAKSFLVPTGTMALVYAASGSVVTVATTAIETSTALVSEASPAPSPAAKAEAAPVAASPKLQAFCAQYWGEMSEDGKLCEFRQVFHVNAAHAGSAPMLTQIPVVPGDIVTLAASAPAHAIVGDVNYGPESAHFVARSEGYLAFRAPEKAPLFAVQQVHVQRCFADDQGQIRAVSCANTL